VRQGARLEALQVSLYKKITFASEPSEAGSVWGDRGLQGRVGLDRVEFVEAAPEPPRS